MIIPAKYIQIRRLCKRYNNGQVALFEIMELIGYKGQKTVFYNGIYHNGKANPYNESKNKSFGIYYYQLWNLGKMISEKYMQEYEPKLF
jgi:hypothetical protein